MKRHCALGVVLLGCGVLSGCGGDAASTASNPPPAGGAPTAAAPAVAPAVAPAPGAAVPPGVAPVANPTVAGGPTQPEPGRGNPGGIPSNYVPPGGPVAPVAQQPMSETAFGQLTATLGPDPGVTAIDPVELGRWIADDPKTFENHLKGEFVKESRLRVRGVVSKVEGTTVYLSTGVNFANSTNPALAQFTLSDPNAILKVLPGQTATLEGKFAQYNTLGMQLTEGKVILLDDSVFVTSDQLAQTAMEGADKLQTKYSGANLKVYGTVAQVSGNQVQLSTGLRLASGSPLMIVLNFADAAALARLNPGTRITVAGRYESLGEHGPVIGGATFFDWSTVLSPASPGNNVAQPSGVLPPAPGGDGMIEVAALALAQEFLSNETAAAEKYRGKLLRISGNVESTASEMLELHTGLTYPQGQPCKVLLRFSGADALAGLRPGEPVVVEGRFQTNSARGPSLIEGRIIAGGPNAPSVANANPPRGNPGGIPNQVNPVVPQDPGRGNPGGIPNQVNPVVPGSPQPGNPGGIPGGAPGVEQPSVGQPGDTPWIAEARKAFNEGRDHDAMRYLYAEALAGQDKDGLKSGLQWFAAQKKPAAAIRWGVAVSYLAPPRYTGGPAPIGRAGSGGGIGNPGGPVNAPGGGRNLPGGIPAGGDPNAPAPDAPPTTVLDYFTAELGTKLMDGMKTRLDQGQFGIVLKTYGENASIQNPAQAVQRDPTGAALKAMQGKLVLPIVPGMVFLGMGKQKDLLAAAKREHLDALIIFDVKVDAGSNAVKNTSKLVLLDVASGKQVHLSKPLSAPDVEAARQKMKGEDPVDQAIERFFTAVDSNFRLDDFPKGLTKENVAQARFVALAETADDDKLTALLEVAFWKERDLADEAKSAELLGKLLGDKAAQLTGPPAQRAALIQSLLPKAGPSGGEGKKLGLP